VTPLLPLPISVKQSIERLLSERQDEPVLDIFRALFMSAFEALKTFDGYGFANQPACWNVCKVAGTSCMWRFSLAGVRNAPRDSRDYRLVITFTEREITGRFERDSAIIAAFDYKIPSTTVEFYNHVKTQEAIRAKR
jgi:hypothetical protein